MPHVKILAWRLLLATLLLSAGLSPRVEAQAPAPAVVYEQIDHPLRNDSKGVQKLLNQVRQIFSREESPGKILPTDQTAFDQFAQLKIAELTWPENWVPSQPSTTNPPPLAVSANNLSRRRIELKVQFLQSSFNKAGINLEFHDKLNAKLLELAAKVALNDKHHPLARYNALIIVGGLDRRERGENPIPQPLAEALVVLLDVAKDPKQPVYLRSAALDGIQRHCETEIPTNGRPVAVQALLGIAKSPEGSSAAGPAWLRKRSVQCLGILADRGASEANKPEVVEVAVALLRDSAASINARCEAAYAIGSIDKGALTQSKSAEVITHSGELLKAIGEFCSDPARSKPTNGDVRWYLTAVRTALVGTTLPKTPEGVLAPNPAKGGLIAATSPAAEKDAGVKLQQTIEQIFPKGSALGFEEKFIDDPQVQKFLQLASGMDAWLNTRPRPAVVAGT